jgi:hypothetical protein
MQQAIFSGRINCSTMVHIYVSLLGWGTHYKCAPARVYFIKPGWQSHPWVWPLCFLERWWKKGQLLLIGFCGSLDFTSPRVGLTLPRGFLCLPKAADPSPAVFIAHRGIWVLPGHFFVFTKPVERSPNTFYCPPDQLSSPRPVFPAHRTTWAFPGSFFRSPANYGVHWLVSPFSVYFLVFIH